MRTSPAFTLIEILVVIGILGIVSIPVVISFNSSRANQALISESEQLADRVHKAHIFAREAKDTRQWGVKSDSDQSYSLISGSAASFTPNDTFYLDHNVFINTPFTIWFDIGTGENTNTQTIELKNSHGTQKQIIIYPTGVVEILPG